MIRSALAPFRRVGIAGLAALTAAATAAAPPPAATPSPGRECLEGPDPLEQCLEARIDGLRGTLGDLHGPASKTAADAIDRMCASLVAGDPVDSARRFETICRAEHLAAHVAALRTVAGLSGEEAELPPSGESEVAGAEERPRADPEPGPSPEAAPPPQAEGPAGRALTAAATPPSRREIVDMASPMELEVDILVLADLRKGYGWSTKETEPFRADGVSVSRIVVEKEGSRKSPEIVVTTHVHGARYLQRARLGLTLLAPDGSPVDSGATDWFPIGRSIQAQADDGLEKTFRFEVSEEQMERLTAGPEPPGLRLRVEAETD